MWNTKKFCYLSDQKAKSLKKTYQFLEQRHNAFGKLECSRKKCCTFTTIFGHKFPLQFGVKSFIKSIMSNLHFSQKGTRSRSHLYLSSRSTETTQVDVGHHSEPLVFGHDYYFCRASLLFFVCPTSDQQSSRPLLDFLSPSELYSICCVHKKSVSGLTYSVLKALLMGHDKGHAALSQKLFISASKCNEKGVDYIVFPLGLIPQKSSKNRITIRRRQEKNNLSF